VKYLVKFFVVTFLLLICTYVSAEQKVAYMDMKFVLNNSKAGKGAHDFLQKSFKENQKKFLDEENTLKKKENDLLAQKTILTKKEYQKKSDDLRKKVIDYQSQRRTALEKITSQRAEARQKLLEKLDPIMKTYIKENDISLIIDRKNVLMGNTNLDITAETAPTYDFLNQLLNEVVIPISDISGNYLNSNFPKLSKLLKWKYRKKLDKITQVWSSGQLTGENFIKFKSYRLLIYKK